MTLKKCVIHMMVASAKQIATTFTLLNYMSQNNGYQTQQAVSLVEEQYASMREIKTSTNMLTH